jgi:hypothetical protein
MNTRNGTTGPNRRSLPILLLCGFFVVAATLPALAAPDSKGTDFWLTFPGNFYGGATLTLFITGDVPTTGQVTIPGLEFSTPFTVTPPEVTSVSIPSSADLGSSSDVVTNLGIHVTALNEVSVYGLNRIIATTDAYLGLPTDILGTEYIVLAYKNVDVVNGTQFAIVGTQDGTTVTITPSVTTGGRVVGVPYTITMNQGQTYQLRNTDPAPADLSGTITTSDKPIAVFGSHQCANIPPGYYACDHIVEELPPTVTWGKNFVTMPLATRLRGDTFRFLASTDGTVVSVNGAVVATLNRGQLFEQIITEPAQITATQPILVAQYSNSSDYDGVTSDPFMMLIPPYEQFLGSYTVTTPASGFMINYINVVAPTAAVGAITLDGSPIPSSSFVAIGSSGFSGAQVAVSLGSHTLSALLPFGVFVYGFDSYDSYGYPGGLSLAPVVRVTHISLAPKTATNPVGTEHCVTATVTDQNDQPVVGVRVDFNISGANPTAGFATTDNNGHAQACYVGTNPGTDTIVASVGTLSDTATKVWVATGNTVAMQLTGCTVCQPGDRFAIQAMFTLGSLPAQPAPSLAAQVPPPPPPAPHPQLPQLILVEVKLGVEDPGGNEMAVSFLNTSHFEMQVTPGTTIGPVTVLEATIPSGLQPGTWKYVVAILDSELGVTLARQCLEFTIVEPGAMTTNLKNRTKHVSPHRVLLPRSLPGLGK